MPYYYDPNEKNPEPINVSYNDDESKRIFEFAEWFAARCEVSEWPIPPDPQRAMLEGAELFRKFWLANEHMAQQIRDARGKMH